MTKFVTSAALDAAFAYIAERADLVVLTAGVPASFTEATTLPGEGGKKLASAALTEGLGGGDFTTAPDPVAGQRLWVGAVPQLVAGATGIADHVVLADQNTGAILVVTELTEPEGLTAGQIVALRRFSAGVTAPV